MIDHVVAHLDEPIDLETAAEIAVFSPFHFHRIFKSLMGETLNEFVGRVRLERALAMRTHQPNRTLTEIAFACGFSSSSDFSRRFKKRFGVPPNVFDGTALRETRRAELAAIARGQFGAHRLDRVPLGENPDGFAVELRQVPARTVAYIRVSDSYRPGAVEKATERLIAWAEARGAADNQWLGYMWDDPTITALEDCRYDVAIEVSGQTAECRPDGEIGRFEFPAMFVAEVPVRGGIDLELRALDWLYGTWLPRSGYVPDRHPSFEAWMGRPFAHGTENFEIWIQLPVVRA